MKLFCEGFVREILPAVRSLIANELIETHKLTQMDVANKMGLTQGAVSQYARSIRGMKTQKIIRDEIIYSEIKIFSEMLVNGISKKEVSDHFCKICKLVKDRKLIDGYSSDDCLD